MSIDRLNIDRLREKLNNLVFGIARNAIDTNGQVPKFWQLYLDADKRFSKVDTCATSHCLSILAHANFADKDLINNAVASVVRLRNEEGSWPSAITTLELARPETRMKGDTAIGDNCYALTALIDAGFLDKQFRYTELLPEEYKSLYYRVQFILKAVNWLLNNKATDNLGWYYTDNKETPHNTVMLTTINVLQVFSKIVNCLNACIKSDVFDPVQEEECKSCIDMIIKELKRIVEEITDDNNIFDDIQFEWEAIGTSIRTESPSLIHTCKLINLILYNNKFNNLYLFSEVKALAQYVIDKSSTQEVFESSCNDFYFEYYDLNKFNVLGLPESLIQVDHENFAEGIVLSTLLNLRLNGYTVKVEAINTVLDLLLKHMSKTAPNFFYCRSHREEEHGLKYPVYASYEAYMALMVCVDNWNLICATSGTRDSITISDAFGFKEELLAQISRLETYMKDPEHIAQPNLYRSSIDDCVKLIKSLNGIISILSDSNYIEEKNIYDTTLLPSINRIL